MPHANMNQVINVPSSDFAAIHSGNKRYILHADEVSIEPGFMLVTLNEKPDQSTYVWVTDVYFMTVKAIAAKTGTPLNDVMADIRKTHQDITPDTRMTLIMHLSPQETAKIFPGS